MKSVIVVVVSSLSLLANASLAQNLIEDGNFDSLPVGISVPGTPLTVGQWTFENYSGVDPNGAGGFSGNPGNFCPLEDGGGGSSDPRATRTVGGLTIGATYVLSWDFAMRVNHSGGEAGPSFGVFLDTQTFETALFLGSILDGGLYSGRSASFVATSTTHQFIFAGELDGRSNGAGATDVSYRLDNVALVLHSATGQGNGGLARLELNGLGAGTLAGPYAVHVPGNGTLSFHWEGPPSAPIALIAGAPNVASTPLGCAGLLDIASPQIILPVGQITLDANGVLDFSLTLPGLPAGSVGRMQGIILQPVGSPCPATLTSAFELIPF